MSRTFFLNATLLLWGSTVLPAPSLSAYTLPVTTTQIQKTATPQTSAVTPPDPRAQNVMERLLDWLKSYKSLTANFRYSVSQSGGRPQTGNGHILLQGKAYRLQMDRTVFLCDGRTLAVYQPDLEEVNLQDYDPAQDELNPFLWLTDHEKRFRTKYIRLQNQNGSLQEVVDLIPTQAAPFQKIRLFVHQQEHRLEGMELYDTQDRIYAYLITDYVFNPPVKPDDFTFDPARHPDVQVNDMR